MDFIPTGLPEVMRIAPRVFEDDRGFFMETWRADAYKRAGINLEFVQENVSHSVRRYTLRGIHYQLKQPQGKLVRVAHGEVYDVAIDLRRSSPTYLRWVGVHLSALNKNLLWIPPGFGHAFLVLSEEATFEYKCTDYYAPSHERTIRWDDPKIAVPWPLPAGRTPVLSQKDAHAPLSTEVETFE